MKDWSYQVLVKGLDALLWGGELLGEENLPESGPAIFIANHLGPLGPIGTICSIPYRFYPWVVGEMMDPILAPDYIRIDFVEPRLKMSPPFSLKFSNALTRITVPMFRSLDGIPSFSLGRQELINKTLNDSLAKLMDGKYLLVFPEYAILGSDSLKKIYPFQKTVFRLGEMYYSATRQRLSFYPVAVHESHKVKVGAPFLFSPLSQPVNERLRLKRSLETAVHRLYLEMDQINKPEKLMNPSTN